MAAARYIQDHARRFEFTISRARPFLEGRTQIGVVGSSPFDGALLSAFPGSRFTTILPDQASTKHFDRTSPLFSDVLFVDLASESASTESRFDAIIFTEVLEHILGDDETVVSNLAGLLRQNGILVFSVPNAATLSHRIQLLFGRNIHWTKREILVSPGGGFGHLREYTVREVIDLLRPHFGIQLIEGINGYRKGVYRLANVLPSTFANTILAVGSRGVKDS